MISELAVHAFTLDHGKPPRLLADLTPQYLPRLPDDPYGRGPMRYRLEEDSSVVYSLGPDEDDDLGKGLEWIDLFANGDDGDLVLGVLFKPAE